MFTSAEFYIIVGNRSLIIRKEGSDLKEVIESETFVPNIPFYYYFFNEQINYYKKVGMAFKRLNIKKAIAIIPDDAMELEIDKRVITQFFQLCGVRKVQLKTQGSLLSLDNKKYISISKTVRTVVLQYIVDNEVAARRYYDKNYVSMEEIALGVKTLHSDCEFENIPVYINNMDKDMDDFKALGNLVSLENLINSIGSFKLKD